MIGISHFPTFPLSHLEHICDFAPPNDYKVSVGAFNANNMTEQKFNQIIDEINSVYAPIAQSKGYKLTWVKKWSDSTSNATAQKSGSNWILTIYGGLMRNNNITYDSMRMVIAHELSHVIGGAPHWSNSGQMSSEGSADTNAALKVMRTFLPKVSEDISPSSEALSMCSNVKSYPQEHCARILDAGVSLGNTLSSLGGGPTNYKLTDTDNNVVNTTMEAHPAALCRLSQYREAGLCDKPYSIEVSSSDPRVGHCNLPEAHSRMKCWYKDKTTPTDPEDPCESDPESCEPNDDEIPNDFKIASSPFGLMFTFDLTENCPAVYVEVKKGKFTTPNADDFDKKSYLGLRGEVGEDSFVIPFKYFKRRTDNYLRYFCHAGDSRIYGLSSNALKYKRK
jgi:hypothetical protein